MLEVLHLVAVTVPVDGEHRVEVSRAVHGWDVRRHQIRSHAAHVAVAARGVERARRTGGIPAVSGREAGAAAQVHGVPERRSELREVPCTTVLAAEVGVARRAGDVGRVARGADGASRHGTFVEQRRRMPEAEVIRHARIARRSVEERLAVEDRGERRVADGDGAPAVGDPAVGDAARIVRLRSHGQHRLGEEQRHAVRPATVVARGAGPRRVRGTAEVRRRRHHVAGEVVGDVHGPAVGRETDADRCGADAVRHRTHLRRPARDVRCGVEVEPRAHHAGLARVETYGIVAADRGERRLRGDAVRRLVDNERGVGGARLRRGRSARPVRRRRTEQRGDIAIPPPPCVEEMEAVGHLVNDGRDRPVGGELDVARVVRRVDVDLADDVAVGAIELVDREARDVVRARVVQVTRRRGRRNRCPPAPARRRIGKRTKRQAREERRSRLSREPREALEETLAEVVLLCPAHPHFAGVRAGGHDRDRREQVQHTLAGVLRLARRGVGGDREHRGHAPRRHVDHAHVGVGPRLRRCVDRYGIDAGIAGCDRAVLGRLALGGQHLELARTDELTVDRQRRAVPDARRIRG